MIFELSSVKYNVRKSRELPVIVIYSNTSTKAERPLKLILSFCLCIAWCHYDLEYKIPALKLSRKLIHLSHLSVSETWGFSLRVPIG